jgi:hypothetical protein
MVEDQNYISSREKEKPWIRTHNVPQDLKRRKILASNGKREHGDGWNSIEYNKRTSNSLYKKRRAYGKEGRQHSRRHQERGDIFDQLYHRDGITQNIVSKDMTGIPSTDGTPQNMRQQSSCDSGRSIKPKASTFETKRRRTYGRKSRKYEYTPKGEAPKNSQEFSQNSISTSLPGGEIISDYQEISTYGKLTYVKAVTVCNFRGNGPCAKDSTVLSAIYRREIGTIGNGLTRQCNEGLRNVTMSKKLGKRIIPFSKLQTPVMDAILDFDRTGSYLIGIGNGAVSNEERKVAILRRVGMGTRTDLCDGCFPSLSLRCYDVPSPAKTRDYSHTQKISKHVFTIPLIMDRSNQQQSSGHSSLGFSIEVEEEASASNTPTQILMSHDGSVGVTFVHHSSSPVFHPDVSDPSLLQRCEEVLGSIVLHPLPSPLITSRIRTFKCSNVRIDGWKHTMRNLLWPAPFIPCANSRQEESDNIFESYRSTDFGYILFNDEKNGYRIFWIEYSPVVRDEAECNNTDIPTSCSRYEIKPSRNDIIINPYQSGVESHWTEITSGLTTTVDQSGICTEDGFQIPMEAYLQIDALFADILCRKKHFLLSTISPSTETALSLDQTFSHLPEFFYNLVSVDNARSVILVIAFSNPCFKETNESSRNTRKVPSALGVFVQLDLFDQSYSELEWVQHPTRQGATFLRQWINVLALNRRMKEVGAGPYCVKTMRSSTSNLPCFGVKFHDMDNMEQPRDFDETTWSSFVKKRLSKTDCQAEPPHEVSMTSLYPFCDLISNRAVTNRTPLTNIVCSRCPIELRYG